MKLPFVAPATFSVCTLLSGCVEQTPAEINQPAAKAVPSTASSDNGLRPSPSDCFRDRLAEYRKMHGIDVPLKETRVTEWLEYCQGG